MQRCVQLVMAVLTSRIWAGIRLGMWLQMLVSSVWEKEMEKRPFLPRNAQNSLGLDFCPPLCFLLLLHCCSEACVNEISKCVSAHQFGCTEGQKRRGVFHQSAVFSTTLFKNSGEICSLRNLDHSNSWHHKCNMLDCSGVSHMEVHFLMRGKGNTLCLHFEVCWL